MGVFLRDFEAIRTASSDRDAPRRCETLERNKTLQGSGFFVAKGALAKGNVYAAKKAALDGPDTMTQRQWMFHKTSRKQTASTSLVKSWDLKTLRE